MQEVVFETHLPRLRARGKVRDLYDLDAKTLMIVATDRLSAFDVVMSQPIVGKGRILTRLTEFWLNRLDAARPHHLLHVVDEQHVPDALRPFLSQISDRALICRKTDVLPVECVVRGYLIGGGWREYQQTGCVSGVRLPTGLALASKLSEPIFTPSTKAERGHDMPISFERACEIAGRSWMEQARDRSHRLYAQASEHAEQRGIIIADTKFEFGIADDELLLIDEVLTPDSSRFWERDSWTPGQSPRSFDKQFVRDYLETLVWNQQPPAPTLPADVVEGTARRYAEAFSLLTADLPV